MRVSGRVGTSDSGLGTELGSHLKGEILEHGEYTDIKRENPENKCAENENSLNPKSEDMIADMEETVVPESNGLRKSWLATFTIIPHVFFVLVCLVVSFMLLSKPFPLFPFLSSLQSIF